tara:strand:- start:43 stop:426 length:384 start_codon:yes stop_codon:yes gene_type:complete
MYWMSAERMICASHVVSDAAESRQGLHGHNWKVSAHVRAERLDRSGQVLSPTVLEAELWAILDPIDHRHLNDLASFHSGKGPFPTTAAGLARLVGEQLAARINDDRVQLRRVDVRPRAGLLISWEQP